MWINLVFRYPFKIFYNFLHEAYLNIISIICNVVIEWESEKEMFIFYFILQGKNFHETDILITNHFLKGSFIFYHDYLIIQRNRT